jgi:hypothetical protein
MADLYIDWGSFCVGFVIGSICVYYVADLVFPIRNKNE